MSCVLADIALDAGDGRLSIARDERSTSADERDEPQELQAAAIGRTPPPWRTSL